PLYQKAIEGWRSLGPEFDVHRATTLVNRGQALCTMGDRHQGAESFEEAVAIYRRTIGIQNERVLAAINLLASSRLMLGESAKAEVLLNEALPIERAKFPKSIQLARTLAGFAIMHTNHGRPDLAIPFVNEALEIGVAAE